jgi:hypothetical protein
LPNKTRQEIDGFCRIFVNAVSVADNGYAAFRQVESMALACKGNKKARLGVLFFCINKSD